jgi:hypothetical protein
MWTWIEGWTVVVAGDCRSLLFVGIEHVNLPLVGVLMMACDVNYTKGRGIQGKEWTPQDEGKKNLNNLK